MKNFEYKVGDKVINIRFDEARGTVAEFLVDGATASPLKSRCRPMPPPSPWLSSSMKWKWCTTTNRE